jgi:hypothetical protein
MSQVRELTREDLMKLSRRGMAAFAARCARRVQPLFDVQDREEAVREAIKVAENFANGGEGNFWAAYNAAVATGGSHGHSEPPAVSAGVSSGSSDRSGPWKAAEAACEAAGSAARTGSVHDDAAPTFAARAAAFAVAAAAAAGGASGGADAASAANIDYENLVKLGQVAYPEPGDAVDPFDSGPLGRPWLNGEPNWLRTAAAGVTELQTVPDFFQEETEDALRSQVEWFGKEAGVDHAFFAGLLRVDEADFEAWIDGRGALPLEGEQALCGFWHTALHLLSFLNFEGASVQKLFGQAPPAGKVAPPYPPWGGYTLKEFLQAGGPQAVEKVDEWVTGLRFGGPYAA